MLFFLFSFRFEYFTDLGQFFLGQFYRLNNNNNTELTEHFRKPKSL